MQHPRMRPRRISVAVWPMLAAGALAACSPQATAPEVARMADAHLTLAEDSATPPPGSPAGACYARDRTPVRIQTVTEHFRVTDEVRDAEGHITAPATYRTETHQSIEGGGEDQLVETPCKGEMTPELIASLQRALQVRGYYHGPITGFLEGETRAALRSWQQTRGLDSPILSLDSARALGLIPIDRDTMG